MARVPVEDRLDIQELVARYAFRCDTGGYSQIGELFADDGVFDESVIGLPRCAGRAEIEAVFPSVGDALEYLIHINANHQITEYGDGRASATCHLHAEGRYLGSDFRILGYYADDYVKVEDRWLFAHRKLIEIAPSTGFPAAGGDDG